MPELTLADVITKIELQHASVLKNISSTRKDISELKALIAQLEILIKQLESISQSIKDKTDGLPKGFVRAGATYRLRG